MNSKAHCAQGLCCSVGSCEEDFQRSSLVRQGPPGAILRIRNAFAAAACAEIVAPECRTMSAAPAVLLSSQTWQDEVGVVRPEDSPRFWAYPVANLTGGEGLRFIEGRR